MRRALPALVLVALAVNGVAAVNINLENIRNSVVFLYGANEKGEINPAAQLGTGFFVQVKLATNPVSSYTLLVTARHIVDPQWANCLGPNPRVIYARLNRREANTGIEPSVGDLRLVINQPTVLGYFKHDDENVDVAVFLIKAGKLQSFQYIPVPLALFPTDEDLRKISVGSNVVSAGLIAGASGQKRNEPFFKFGMISNLSDETIDMKCFPANPSRAARLWFVDVNMGGGNSGAPIFYVPPDHPRPQELRTPRLLGVQSMAFSGHGIGGMTPVRYLYEVIEKMGLPDADLRRGQPEPTSGNPAP